MPISRSGPRPYSGLAGSSLPSLTCIWFQLLSVIVTYMHICVPCQEHPKGRHRAFYNKTKPLCGGDTPLLDFSRGNRCCFHLYTCTEGPKHVVSELGLCLWAVSLPPPALLGRPLTGRDPGLQVSITGRFRGWEVTARAIPAAAPQGPASRVSWHV